jgi:hypothetical protein
MRFAWMLIFVVGCESGVSARVDFTVSDDVASEFSADAPGVLRADIAGFKTSIKTICGPLAENPFRDFIDFGFGCLDEREGRTDPLSAWIEPVASDATTCDSLPIDELADAPQEDWHQGESTMTWRRDFSVCGGIGEGAITIE